VLNERVPLCRHRRCTELCTKGNKEGEEVDDVHRHRNWIPRGSGHLWCCEVPQDRQSQQQPRRTMKSAELTTPRGLSQDFCAPVPLCKEHLRCWLWMQCGVQESRPGSAPVIVFSPCQPRLPYQVRLILHVVCTLVPVILLKEHFRGHSNESVALDRTSSQLSEFSSPWRWRQHGPPKRWYPTTRLPGVTIQKNLDFHRRENLKIHNCQICSKPGSGE